MPKLSKTLVDAFNEQINNEIYSAYFYLGMAAHCDAAGLKGAAHWLHLQWDEELSHAMKLIRHVSDRGNQVVLDAIEKPPSEFKSVQIIFEKVLEHEREVTSSIYKLCDLAAKEKDHASTPLLQWFLTEQIEEEKVAGGIIDMFRLAGDKGSGLLMIDRQLAARGPSDHGA